MHISRAHPDLRKQFDLYLSAHKISTEIHDFVYFILENKIDGEESKYQTILKFKFKR